MSPLHHLQASFNSKVTDKKESADLLSEHVKKVSESVHIKTVANKTTAAPPLPPVVVALLVVKPLSDTTNISRPKRINIIRIFLILTPNNKCLCYLTSDVYYSSNPNKLITWIDWREIKF